MGGIKWHCFYLADLPQWFRLNKSHFIIEININWKVIQCVSGQIRIWITHLVYQFFWILQICRVCLIHGSGSYACSAPVTYKTVFSALQKHLVDMNIEGIDSSYVSWIVSTSGSHSSLSSPDVRIGNANNRTIPNSFGIPRLKLFLFSSVAGRVFEPRRQKRQVSGQQNDVRSQVKVCECERKDDQLHWEHFDSCRQVREGFFPWNPLLILLTL